MKVGVPTEIKTDEYRVALTPSGVRELVEHDHEVQVQKGAGEGSAISDNDYTEQGARIVPDASCRPPTVSATRATISPTESSNLSASSRSMARRACSSRRRSDSVVRSCRAASSNDMSRIITTARAMSPISQGRPSAARPIITPSAPDAASMASASAAVSQSPLATSGVEIASRTARMAAQSARPL